MAAHRPVRGESSEELAIEVVRVQVGDQGMRPRRGVDRRYRRQRWPEDGFERLDVLERVDEEPDVAEAHLDAGPREATDPQGVWTMFAHPWII